MTIEEKKKKHQEILNNLHETYLKKQADYGDSFGKSYEKYGIVSAMVRMEDKWNRLDNLISSKNEIMVKDESISDTLLDLANYAIMTYMEMTKEDEKNIKTITEEVPYEILRGRNDIR